MPRKLDFSKVTDISLEDTQATTDVQAIMNNLIPTKKNNKLQISDNNIDINIQTPALTHVETSVQTLALTHDITHSLAHEVVTTESPTITANKPFLEKPKSLVKRASKVTPTELTVKDMARWHTKAEQKVYKAMLSETQKQETQELYFSVQELTTRTRFKNRRTIMAAIAGLVAKHSIAILIDRHGDHYGRCYRVFLPTEILERRKQFQIQIHPQTKKILLPPESSVPE